MLYLLIISVSIASVIEAIHGMDIPLCSESTQSQYPYPEDCTKYIQCNNGQAAVLNCGPGSNFNPKTHQCDSSYVKQDCHNLADSQETLRMFCKNVINGPISHPFDCSKFIECSSAMSTIKNCPPGLVYNSKIKVCDWPTSVQGCLENNENGKEHLSAESTNHQVDEDNKDDEDDDDE
uniref:Venom protein Ci-23c n=1 Tax=Chelonus inanitus TaxID=49201 RepID=E6ZCJ3_9HYME|nr:venom protein Ci-23c [Chelonus inanitus]